MDVHCGSTGVHNQVHYGSTGVHSQMYYACALPSSTLLIDTRILLIISYLHSCLLICRFSLCICNLLIQLHFPYKSICKTQSDDKCRSQELK